MKLTLLFLVPAHLRSLFASQYRQDLCPSGSIMKVRSALMASILVRT